MRHHPDTPPDGHHPRPPYDVPPMSHPTDAEEQQP
jgi:hypothetical protein